MSVRLTLSFLFFAVAVVNATSILDYFNWEDSKSLIQLPELRDDQPNRNCMCKGAACVCCVEFNITFVDLGGPGCVHMKYLSPEEGFSVKVSYGKSLIHNSKINGTNPKPICLEVFGKFAQVCAKFSDLAPTSDGLRGCLELEPKLLGEGQLDFPIGCFKSTPGGMEMEDPPAEPESATEEDEEEEEEEGTNTENTDFDAQSFISGVVQTAEVGIDLLSKLLGVPKTHSKPLSTTEPSESSSTDNSERRAINFKHPNQL